MSPAQRDAPRIAIITIEQDFHAYAIRHALAGRGVPCAIIDIDGLPVSGGMSWSPSEEAAHALVHDVDGNEVVVRDLDVIWWRRFRGTPRIPDDVRDEAARELVDNDCRATILGLVLTEFRGLWISHPEATRAAENKLVQLRAAYRAGLRLPRTLVSQDPEAVRAFCRELDFRVIAKPVSGTRQTPIMTGRVTPEMLAPEAVRLSPAIYQEYIPGTQHLRVCCFGDEIHTALLETEALDWRYPLDATAQPYELDAGTSAATRRVLDKLGLRMGIMDMKLLPGGEPVWLEVNPQGQFLFLEGMCDMPLTEIFADYLLDEARRVAPVASVIVE